MADGKVITPEKLEEVLAKNGASLTGDVLISVADLLATVQRASVVPDPPEPTKTTEAADKLFRLQLKNRTDRLQRLIALDSPAFILVQEAMLVLKAAGAMSKEGISMALGELFFDAARFGAGICSNEECGAKLEENKRYGNKCNACNAMETFDEGSATEN